MAVLDKAFKASCVAVLLPRELATGQHLLGQLRLRLQLRHVLDLHVRIVNRVGMHRGSAKRRCRIGGRPNQKFGMCHWLARTVTSAAYHHPAGADFSTGCSEPDRPRPYPAR